MFCRHVFGNLFWGNFAGFRGNTWISRVRAKYQKPCLYNSHYSVRGFNKHWRPTKCVRYFAQSSRLLFCQKKKQLVLKMSKTRKIYYRTGCRNVSHCQQHQSYSGLRSPGRSNSTFWNDSWVQTFHTFHKKYIIKSELKRKFIMICCQGPLICYALVKPEALLVTQTLYCISVNFPHVSWVFLCRFTQNLVMYKCT